MIVPPLLGVRSVHEGSFEAANDNILELVWRQLKGIAAKPQLTEHVGLAHCAVVGADRDRHAMVEHVLQRVVQQIPLELWNYLQIRAEAHLDAHAVVGNILCQILHEFLGIGGILFVLDKFRREEMDPVSYSLGVQVSNGLKDAVEKNKIMGLDDEDREGVYFLHLR